MKFINDLTKYEGMVKIKILLVLIACFSVFIPGSAMGLKNNFEPGDTIKGAKSKESLEFIKFDDITRVDLNRDTSFIKFGGALRFNYKIAGYNRDEMDKGGSFTWDTWRLNVDGQTKGILLSMEYRFYPNFSTHFIHHGWFGYSFTENTQMQLGVTQVPFGNLPYASHSWWFQTPYYVGLEDDYDMGIKISHNPGDWDLDFGFFKEAEPNGPAVFGNPTTARYSYDVLPTDVQVDPNDPDQILRAAQSNEEVNQFNGRIAYNLDQTKIGISGQYGQIRNFHLRESGTHTALAGHVDGSIGNVNINSEIIYYNYSNVMDDQGNTLEEIPVGAYGFGTYDIAAEATMYVLGISYSIPVDWGPISNITLYENYTYTDKMEDNFIDTQQNTLGMLLTAGTVYTYVDIASGKNHPWLTGNFGEGLGKGVTGSDGSLIEDPEWKTRLNINIGYYF